MHLWHRLSMRARWWWRRPVYRLELRLEPTADEDATIRRHRLEGDMLYVGPIAEGHEDKALSALELARDAAHDLNRGKARQLRWKAFAEMRAARREARCSLAEALAGKSFESEEAAELSAVLAAIGSAVNGLHQKLELMAALEIGAEGKRTPREPQDEGVPPAGWFDARRQ